MKKLLLISLFILFVPFLVLSSFDRTPINISEGGDNNCIVPRMAIDKWGNIHVVWEEYVTAANNEIFYRKYSMDGLSKRINISKNSWPSREPDVAVDENGNVYIVWADRFSSLATEFSIAFREIDKNGNLRETKKVIPSPREGFRLPSIASSPNGNLSIVTYTDNNKVYGVWRDNGNWANPKIIQRGSALRAGESASVVWGENGRFYGAWPEYNPNTDPHYTIYYSNREIGEQWSKPMIVNSTGDAQCHPKIRVEKDGTIHLVWMDEENSFEIAYERWDPNEKKWDMPVVVSGGHQLCKFPSFTIKESGEIYVCWVVGVWGRLENAYYSFKDINGVWNNNFSIRETSIVNPCFIEFESGGPNDNLFFIYASSVKEEGKKEVFLITEKPIEVMPAISPPLDVQVLKATSKKINPYWDTESYVITWEENPVNEENDINIDSYYIYRKIKGDRTEKKIGEVHSDEFLYVDSDFDNNKTYVYGVSSVDEEGNESSISFDED